MTSSVGLCDFPNTFNCKLKSVKGTKDFTLRGVRNNFVVFLSFNSVQIYFRSPLRKKSRNDEKDFEVLKIFFLYS